MADLVLGCQVFVGLCLCFVLLMKWNGIRYRSKGLPPGTTGWPFFGETFEFFKYGTEFMKKQRSRYGSLFKTHFLGSPIVVCMDAELIRYILLNEGKGLIPGYTKSTLAILGECNIAAVHGPLHKYIRGSMISLVSPPMIKDHLLYKLDSCVRSFIRDWDGKNIDIQEKTVELAFRIAFKQIVELESDEIYEKFKPEFDKLVKGAISLPIYIPGTIYHDGYQGRTRVIKMLRQIIKNRRASAIDHHDILGQLLRSEETNYPLSDEQIFDQIITILFSGYETVSTTTMMAIKYLHDHPKALHQVREEHFAIRSRKKPEDPIDWDDFKSMNFTRAVVFETSRLATVVNGLLRKTTQDIELNGFMIPKGWRIYLYLREINHDPFMYEEPLTFNPWRWLDKSMENHKYCFVFGGGGRLCPGKEMGIVKVCAFIHYFLTQFRWEEVGRTEILKFPRVEAPDGLHLKISKY